jgi:putative aldouronate transport system substrate-binding protein
MRFLFELNNVDNQRIAKYGEEGVDWEPIEVDGREIVNKLNDVINNPNNKTWCWNTPCLGYPDGESPYEVYEPEVVFEELDEAAKIKYWRDNMLEMMVEANYPNTVNNPELFFSVVYNEEETEENGTMVTDIKNFMKQQRGLFITGQLDIDDDAVWAEYVNALEVQGLSVVLQNAQDAWDRQK